VNLGKKIVLGVILGLFSTFTALAYYPLPPLPRPDKYGDVLMDRSSSANGEKAVVFSHWSHRIRYTCRVCHFELDIELSAGRTEISEEENRDGYYCGACHDGKQAFGHTAENCQKCHTGPDVDRTEQFYSLRDKIVLPRASFGNKIDWVKALQGGSITPLYSLFKPDEKPMAFDKRLELAAEWNWVPPAVFDHATHAVWLDCANCHPDIFNIQKKTTKHFSMAYILEKKFCGACHYSVALPLDDCHACHPGMNRRD